MKKVKCIDNDGLDTINLFYIYEVTYEGKLNYGLKGKDALYEKYRFENVTETNVKEIEKMKNVRCMNNEGMEDIFTNGQIYEVTVDDERAMVNGVNLDFIANRFEDVSE